MDNPDYLNLILHLNNQRINSLKSSPVKNYSAIHKLKIFNKSIQAMTEGQRDILNTRINNFSQSTAREIDKNNYQTYSSQVDGAYSMYKSRANYGGELLGGIVDTRVAFIAGEGISVIAEDGEESATQKYIDEFIQKNKLNGSRLMSMILISELEGRNLITLTPDKNAKYVKARSFSWYVNNYKINVNPLDTDEVKTITYREKKEDTEDKTILGKECVYVKIGGTEISPDETTCRIHRVLTDIENCSRAKYDLRKNTHVFGKYMMMWETKDAISAKMINDAIADKSWEIGDGYAGAAKTSLIEPSGGAGKAILDDFMLALKCVSSTTGVPVHWLAWPELMSNRATADNLMEVVKAATQKERLIWEEGLTELIKKSMTIAIDNGIAKNDILKSDFTVKLPLVSLALLKQMIEIWEPLHSKEIISDFTLLNLIPGVDPSKEKRLIKKEKDERAKESPFLNGTVNDTLDNLQNKLPGQQQNQKGGMSNGSNANREE